MGKQLSRISLFLVLPWLLIAFMVAGYLPAQAQAGDPYSLVAAVNQLRTANGLPELQINSLLMGVSQAHTDYQASIGEVTHYGPGGSRPRDRAAAAGYGGGANFFMSENIAGGTNLSISEVIVWWQGDDPHLNTMLGANYAEIGAGMAVDGDFVYYTIDTAYVSGGSYSPPATIISGTPGPTEIPIYYVAVATPNADGSVVHIVQSGQTLIGIAQAYGVTVAEIKALNNMTSDVIYVGDQLLIRPPGTPNPSETPSATVTATHQATATRLPTRTATLSQLAAEISATVAPTVTPISSRANPDTIGNILVVAIITIGAGGVVLMIVGWFFKRRSNGSNSV